MKYKTRIIILFFSVSIFLLSCAKNSREISPKPTLNIQGTLWKSIPMQEDGYQSFFVFYEDYYVVILQNRFEEFIKPEQKITYTTEQKKDNLFIWPDNPREAPLVININNNILAENLRKSNLKYKPISLEELNEKLKTWKLEDLDL